MTDGNDNDKVLSLVPKANDEDALVSYLEMTIKRAEVIARLRFAFYTESVKAGFTPEQALTLCQKVTI